MIALQKAIDGVTAFAVKDVVGEMPNNVNKFVALMSISAMKNNPETFLKHYGEKLQAMGIITEDGTSVNTEVLRNSLAYAFEQMPKVSFWGFTFTRDDAAKLIQRMEA